MIPLLELLNINGEYDHISIKNGILPNTPGQLFHRVITQEIDFTNFQNLKIWQKIKIIPQVDNKNKNKSNEKRVKSNGNGNEKNDEKCCYYNVVTGLCQNEKPSKFENEEKVTNREVMFLKRILENYEKLVSMYNQDEIYQKYVNEKKKKKGDKGIEGGGGGGGVVKKKDDLLKGKLEVYKKKKTGVESMGIVQKKLNELDESQLYKSMIDVKGMKNDEKDIHEKRDFELDPINYELWKRGINKKLKKYDEIENIDECSDTDDDEDIDEDDDHIQNISKKTIFQRLLKYGLKSQFKIIKRDKINAHLIKDFMNNENCFFRKDIKINDEDIKLISKKQLRDIVDIRNYKLGFINTESYNLANNSMLGILSSVIHECNTFKIQMLLNIKLKNTSKINKLLLDHIQRKFYDYRFVDIIRKIIKPYIIYEKGERIPTNNRDLLRFLISKLINEDTYFVKRVKEERMFYDKNHINNYKKDKNDNRSLYLPLMKINLPFKLLKLMFSYLVKNGKYILSVSLVSKDWYYTSIQCFNKLVINNKNVYRIPIKFLFNLTSVTLKSEIFNKEGVNDFKYIQKHLKNVEKLEIYTDHYYTCNSFTKKMNVTLYRCKELKVVFNHVIIVEFLKYFLKTLTLYPNLEILEFENGSSSGRNFGNAMYDEKCFELLNIINENFKIQCFKITKWRKFTNLSKDYEAKNGMNLFKSYKNLLNNFKSRIQKTNEISSWNNVKVEVSSFIFKRKKRSCNFCGLKKNVKLMKCSICKIVSYCSKKCQEKDWKNHKQTCVQYKKKKTQKKTSKSQTSNKNP